MNKRNFASSAFLSGILFVIFCMASTFAIGRTAAPANLHGKFGLPPSAFSYQLQEDLAIQSVNELKSYPFLTLVYENQDGQVYLYDPGHFYYFEPENAGQDGYFGWQDYTLGIDRTIGIQHNFSKPAANYGQLAIPALEKENVSEIRNLFALPALQKEGKLYLYSFDTSQQKKAGRLLTSLNAEKIPYRLNMPWLFGLYAGALTDFKTALVMGSSFAAVGLIFFLLLWCPNKIRLNALNKKMVVFNPCNFVSFWQLLIQTGLEFGFAVVLLYAYGIDLQYALQYGLSIVANFELVRWLFIGLHWITQKRKEKDWLPGMVVLSAAGMAVVCGSILLLAEQLSMAIVIHQDLRESLFILLWLVLPLAVDGVLIRTLLGQIQVGADQKSLPRLPLFWKTFLVVIIGMGIVSILILPSVISLSFAGGLVVLVLAAWKELRKQTACLTK